MTTIIGTGEVGALHSREELEEMQRLPLQRKIQITTARIIEWYQELWSIMSKRYIIPAAIRGRYAGGVR